MRFSAGQPTFFMMTKPPARKDCRSTGFLFRGCLRASFFRKALTAPLSQGPPINRLGLQAPSASNSSAGAADKRPLFQWPPQAALYRGPPRTVTWDVCGYYSILCALPQEPVLRTRATSLSPVAQKNRAAMRCAVGSGKDFFLRRSRPAPGCQPEPPQ